MENPGSARKKWTIGLMAGVIAAVLLGMMSVLAGIMGIDYLVDIWWFDALGYGFYYWQRMLYRYAVFLAVMLAFFLIFFLNFWIAARFLKKGPVQENALDQTRRRKLFKKFQTGSIWFYGPPVRGLEHSHRFAAFSAMGTLPVFHLRPADGHGRSFPGQGCGLLPVLLSYLQPGPAPPDAGPTNADLRQISPGGYAGILSAGEDLWTFAEAFGKDDQEVLRPYYVTLDLIDAGEMDFVLLLPMFPKNRDNLRAVAVAGCDPDNYGKLFIYNFPKGRLVYGPAQIDALINQDPDIAEQFTLWDPIGSQVVRGKMIILPVGNSVPYIQPVYLRATSRVKIPELQRVIMSEGEVLVMETSVQRAYTELRRLVALEMEERRELHEPESLTEQQPEVQAPSEGAKIEENGVTAEEPPGSPHPPRTLPNRHSLLPGKVHDRHKGRFNNWRMTHWEMPLHLGR
jgi:hypothetical protein